MRFRVISGFTRAAVALLAAVLLVPVAEAPASATVSRQTINLVGGNTDSTHPVGSVDPNTETSTDGGLTWHPAYLVGVHPWGNVAGTNSWLNCGPSFNNCLNATSDYRYRFYIAPDYANGTMTGAINVDNYADIYLNNTTLASNIAAAGWTTTNMNIQSALQPGWNTLRVRLIDVGGLAGINFNLQVGIDSASPIRLGAPGTWVVDYNAQSGTATRTTDNFTVGAAGITLPTATRTGYDFTGWFTAASGGSQVTGAFVPTADTVLYAHWTLSNYAVTYDSQGGSVAPSDTYQMGGSITLPANPTRYRYYFNGWFDAATGGNLLGATYAPSGTGAITIFAQWTAMPPEGYQGPVVTAQSTHEAQVAGGSRLVISGFRLGLVNAVKVCGMPAKLISVSATEVVVELPAAAAGVCPLVMTTSDGSYEFNSQMRYSAPAAPVVSTKTASLTVSGFAAGSPALTAKMRATIAAFLKVNSELKNLTCTGFTEGPTVLKSDATLSKRRAANSCAFALGVATRVLVGTYAAQETQRADSVRRVVIQLSN